MFVAVLNGAEGIHLYIRRAYSLTKAALESFLILGNRSAIAIVNLPNGTAVGVTAIKLICFWQNVVRWVKLRTSTSMVAPKAI